MTTPRTAAGRALLDHMIEDANGFVVLTSGRFGIKWVLDALEKEIPLIEAEAAALDVDALARALRRTAYADAGLFHELHPAATQTELEAYVDRAAAAIAAAYEKERAG